MVNFGFPGILKEIALLQKRLAGLMDLGMAARWINAEEAGAEGWRPPVDLIEDRQGLTLYVDLPGFTRDDFKLEIHGSMLTLTGNRAFPPEHNTETVYRFERPFGSFRHEIALPPGVEDKNIQAQLIAGVLVVRLPLKRPQGGRKIKVQ